MRVSQPETLPYWSIEGILKMSVTELHYPGRNIVDSNVWMKYSRMKGGLQLV